MYIGLRQADGGDRVDTLGRLDTVSAFSDGVLDSGEGDEYFAGGAAYMAGVAAGDTNISFDGADHQWAFPKERCWPTWSRCSAHMAITSASTPS